MSLPNRKEMRSRRRRARFLRLRLAEWSVFTLSGSAASHRIARDVQGNLSEETTGSCIDRFQARSGLKVTKRIAERDVESKA